MKDKQDIIRLFRTDDISELEISRQTGFSRNTVRRYLGEYKKALEQSRLDSEEEGLEDFLFHIPRYTPSGRVKTRMDDSLIAEIRSCLQANIEKSQTGRSKQRMLKCDIYDLLREKGHIISYSSVCKYIQSTDSSTKESFIRQSYIPGETCEFDWGEIKLYIHGILRTFYLAVFTFAYSNGRKAYLFQRQDKLAFMESHVRFFDDMQGVPVQMVYDNMRVAVAEFIGKTEKRPTTALVNMEAFYGFSHRFCNARKGNEKGHVERSVELIRRKAFCRIDRFETTEEAFIALSQACDKLNNGILTHTSEVIKERMQHDLSSLMDYPGKMGCYEIVSLRVDKWSTVTLNTSHYSVPDHLVGQRVDVKVYSGKLDIRQENRVIATHERSYLPVWSIQLDHYLKTLLRKPGAIAGSVAISQAPDCIKDMYARHFTAQGREFIELMMFCAESKTPYTALHTACCQVEKSGVKEVTAAHIKVILTNKGVEETAERKKDQIPNEIEQNAISQLTELNNLMCGYTTPIIH